MEETVGYRVWQNCILNVAEILVKTAHTDKIWTIYNIHIYIYVHIYIYIRIYIKKWIKYVETESYV